MKILVTGAAGFIGMHVARALLERGDTVIGIDNMNDYYDPQLKYDRLAVLESFPNFMFAKIDLVDKAALEELFYAHRFTHVFNSAAQAGVRYSLQNPQAYIDSNLVGFANILECCRHNDIKHLVFASSSSVYGANTKMPFGVNDPVDHPVSLYAATKKSNEMMAHSYSHLYGIPITGLRFFTVYGPYGRPDMSPSLFTDAILKGEPINVFNNGEMMRDFTYIDDITKGVVRCIDKPASPDPKFDSDNPNPSTSYAPYRLYNIGNNEPVQLMEFIRTIEDACGKTAELNMMEMQAGDVKATYADIDSLYEAVSFKPITDLKQGIGNFVQWYRRYHKL